MRVASLVASIVGDDPPVRLDAWDGSSLGPDDAPAVIRLRSPDALRHIVHARGELGLARAYVAGDIDVEGDIFAALALHDRIPHLSLHPRQLVAAARLVGTHTVWRPPPPPEEVRLHGRRHNKARDSEAIRHHYDVGNRFYELLLGPAMTYSCAVFEGDDTTLSEAQDAKHELICRKLALRPGQRLLDVGCGWGSMVIHAARHHSVEAVGVTLSEEQHAYAVERVEAEGLSGKVEIRLQDYRDIDDGPFDAISSIGMFEHVGAAQAPAYFTTLRAALAPGGRLLNHAIARPAGGQARLHRRGFTSRYVFPDGELQEIGHVVTTAQLAGFEVRHVESLREHYGRTLRAWLANLESGWEEAVAEVGAARARVWRLYVAGSARSFDLGSLQVHQMLAVRPGPRGSSGLGARPDWDRSPLRGTQ